MTVKTEEIVQEDILKEVKDGLLKSNKQLPSKLFYDEIGSKLFDEICKQEEYYPTRTEMQILEDNIDDIVDVIGEDALLVEFGSGSSLKTRLILENLNQLAGYIPIDISSEHLKNSVEILNKKFPGLDIYPLAADYTKEFELPEIRKPYKKIVAYFPGSTIGNFTPEEAKYFLRKISKISGANGSLLIGVDLDKDKTILEKAYNDSNGITAAFNLNMLNHINNKIGSNFNPNNFDHYAFYNRTAGRIEMHLLSKEEQYIRINGSTIFMKKGEDILTEYSYKYSLISFAGLVDDIYDVKKVWLDDKKLFSIQYLEVK